MVEPSPAPARREAAGYLPAFLYMLVAAALFSIMVASVRQASAELHTLQVVFFRNLFSIVVIAPIVARLGLAFLRTTQLKLYGWRMVLGLASMFMWFYAVTVTPIAEAVALNFTAPLFVTLVAIPLLKERVRLPRWLATAIGFGGAMLILRPGFTEVTLGHVLILGSSALMAMSIVVIKKLSATEPPDRIVAYMCLTFTPASLIPALFVWQWPSWTALLWLAAVAASGTLAHLAFTRAIGRADATAVMPLDFMRLPFTALIGYVAFSESPDVWTWVGGAVIFASSIFITHRESRSREREQI